MVDAETLRRARQRVVPGEYHVDAATMERLRAEIPEGEYHVDRATLHRARLRVVTGEYLVSLAAREFVRLLPAPIIDDFGNLVRAREVYLDPDNRPYTLEYFATSDGRQCVSYCLENPWDLENVNAGESYEQSHIDTDGFLCIGPDSLKSVFSSPFGIEFVVLRSRFWAVGFSWMKENGSFPEVS